MTVPTCLKCERGGTGPHPSFCTAEMRFWNKVIVSDGCWEWQGSRHPFGYGQFRIGNGTRRGKMLFAHRYSYELHRGAIGPGLYVLHTCDNPRCVNPDHLVQGTAAENTADMVRKGRQVIQARKTHCGRGHAYGPVTRENGDQRCRECENPHRRKVGGRGPYKPRRTLNAMS